MRVMPPNESRLSCGDVQPVPCRIDAREMLPFTNRPTTRGEIVDGNFRQLEPLVRTQTVEMLINIYETGFDNVYNM